jgi:hypothetical protein
VGVTTVGRARRGPLNGRTWGMSDALSTIFDLFRSQIISVPVNNVLSIIYVILNAILLFFQPLFGG